jgi:hypothetical protein
VSGQIASIVPLVAREFADNGCPALVLYGEDNVAQHDFPLRVVFEPADPVKRPEKFKPPLQIQAVGDLPQTVAYWQTVGGSNPRPVMTRVVMIEVVIWAQGAPQADPSRQRDADQDMLDALLNQTILAVWNVAHGNFRVLAGRQLSSTKSMSAGLSYHLEIEWDVPVVDVPWAPVIDERSRTWPLEDASAAAEVQMLDAAGSTVINQVDFEPGDVQAES